MASSASIDPQLLMNPPPQQQQPSEQPAGEEIFAVGASSLVLPSLASELTELRLQRTFSITSSLRTNSKCPLEQRRSWERSTRFITLSSAALLPPSAFNEQALTWLSCVDGWTTLTTSPLVFLLHFALSSSDAFFVSIRNTWEPQTQFDNFDEFTEMLQGAQTKRHKSRSHQEYEDEALRLNRAVRKLEEEEAKRVKKVAQKEAKRLAGGPHLSGKKKEKKVKKEKGEEKEKVGAMAAPSVGVLLSLLLFFRS
jgi:hypothetical protein